MVLWWLGGALIACMICMVAIILTGGFEWWGIGFHHLDNPVRIAAILAAAWLMVRYPGWWSGWRRWVDRQRRVIVLALAVGAAAATPRLWRLSANSLNIDEIMWMGRGTHLVHYLAQGDPIRATKDLAHPGVLPAALIGWSYNTFGRDVCGGRWAVLDRVTAARLPMSLLGTLTPVVLFALALRLWPLAAAWCGALFLALDPVHIGLSRLAHLDAALTFFCVASILLYAQDTVVPAAPRLSLSAVCWSAALLTKATAFLVPAILLAWRLLCFLRIGRPSGPLVRPRDGAWLMLGLAGYVACFPKLWREPALNYWKTDPACIPIFRLVHAAAEAMAAFPLFEAMLLGVIVALMASQNRTRCGSWKDHVVPAGGRAWIALVLTGLLLLRYVPHLLENIALQLDHLLVLGTKEMGDPGSVTRAAEGLRLPGYSFLLAVRLPVAVLGLAAVGAVLAGGRFGRRADRAAGLDLLPVVVILVFISVMSFSDYAALRYILPVFPFVSLCAGFALTWLCGRLAVRSAGRVSPRVIQCAAVAGAVIATLPSVVRYFPNYYLFHNALIGGPAGAARVLPVGWGEGHREAVDYVKRIIQRDDTPIAIFGYSGVLRYYWEYEEPRRRLDQTTGRAPLADSELVVVIRNGMAEFERVPAASRAPLELVRVISLNGLDMVWVYRRTRAPGYQGQATTRVR